MVSAPRLAPAFRFVIRLVLCALLIGLSARPARAGDEEDANAARDHYRKGLKLYDLLHYKEAALEFEAAYQAKSDPAFLYNIAQSHRLAGEKEQAIGSYRSYLRRVPGAKNSAEVEQRIAELQKIIDEERRVQRIEPAGTLRPSTGPTPAAGPSGSAPESGAGPIAVVTPPPPANGNGTLATTEPAPNITAPKPVTESKPAVSLTNGGASAETASRPGFSKKVAGGVLLVVGVAAAATGIVFGLQATSARDQANNATAGTVFDPSLEDTFKTNRTLSIAMLAGGGALAVTGAVVMALGFRDAKRAAVTVIPTAGPSGAGVAASFRF